MTPPFVPFNFLKYIGHCLVLGVHWSTRRPEVMAQGARSVCRHADIAQLAARRSHNPKVVSSILTVRMFHVAAGGSAQACITAGAETMSHLSGTVNQLDRSVGAIGVWPQCVRILSGCGL